MNNVKVNVGDVVDHLTEVVKKVDNTRDIMRVAWNLINSHIEIEAFDKTPLELSLVIDLLRKADNDLEYFSLSLDEDKDILTGRRCKRQMNYDEYTGCE